MARSPKADRGHAWFAGRHPGSGPRDHGGPPQAGLAIEGGGSLPLGMHRTRRPPDMWYIPVGSAEALGGAQA
jgi:hypothetical protein